MHAFGRIYQNQVGSLRGKEDGGIVVSGQLAQPQRFGVEVSCPFEVFIVEKHIGGLHAIVYHRPEVGIRGQ